MTFAEKVSSDDFSCRENALAKKSMGKSENSHHHNYDKCQFHFASFLRNYQKNILGEHC